MAPRSRFDREHKLDSKSSHLVLLVKNETGYRNLCHMVSLSFTEGFYSKPRVDIELLGKFRRFDCSVGLSERQHTESCAGRRLR